MATSALPIFDAARLHRQTMGDEALQVEVLSLFTAEVERLMRQLQEASDQQQRGERLRALTALARNTGATRLAQEARSAEAHLGPDAPDLAALQAAVFETLAFVRQSKV
jgi:hypothetical protein